MLSTSTTTSAERSGWRSLTQSSPRRAETRQFTVRSVSPVATDRTSAYSHPVPRSADRCTPRRARSKDGSSSARRRAPLGWTRSGAAWEVTSEERNSPNRSVQRITTRRGATTPQVVGRTGTRTVVTRPSAAATIRRAVPSTGSSAAGRSTSTSTCGAPVLAWSSTTRSTVSPSTAATGSKAVRTEMSAQRRVSAATTVASTNGAPSATTNGEPAAMPATSRPTASPATTKRRGRAWRRHRRLRSSALRGAGTGTAPRASATTSRVVTPRTQASGCSTSRWASTTAATCFTSSGTTNGRPRTAATGTCHADERKGGPGAGAHLERRVVPGVLDDADGVVDDVGGDRHGLDDVAEGEQARASSTGRRSTSSVPRSIRRATSSRSATGSGIADRQPRHEAIELRLGEGVGALRLDRVLGRQEHEGVGQRVRHAVHRHLALGHGLEHGRLGLGRSPVDLVTEHEVGEERPGLEGQHPAPVRQRRAGDVAGHEIGRELDAAEGEPGDGRERPRDQRLRHPGHVLDHDVAAGEHGGQQDLEDVALADDGPFHLVEQVVGRGGQLDHPRREGGRRVRRLRRRGQVRHDRIATPPDRPATAVIVGSLDTRVHALIGWPALLSATVESSTRQPAISLRSVTKVFDGGDAAAVRDLSLDVPEGSVMALVGPSGCGKTTTLRMINRLVEPTSGTILLMGTDVSRTPPHELRRGIGYVIQQTGLFPHQTVATNIGTVPRLLGWKARDVTSRVEELVDLVGLDRIPPGPLPVGAERRPAATGRRGEGPRRRPAGAADGRAVQRRRPDRAGATPGRAAARCRPRWARPSSSSRTTSTRRSSWPTGSPS